MVVHPDDPASWVVSLRENLEQRMDDQRALLELATRDLAMSATQSHDEIRRYFERVVSDSVVALRAAREADGELRQQHLLRLANERREDLENAIIQAKLTADATQFHLESRKLWQDDHLALHEKEEEAIQQLATMLAAQRVEDSDAVGIALQTVKDLASEHSRGHEAEHKGHGTVHTVEKEAIEKATQQLDKRLEGMNEFRAQLQEQSVAFVRRDLFDSRSSQTQKERDETNAALGTISTRLTQLEVATATKEQTGDNTSRMTLAISGFLITLFVTAVAVITNVLLAKG